MSSMNYRDKSLEEIRPAVDQYIDTYRKTFGKEPNLEQLKNKLEALKRKKEEEIFTGIFGTMSPKNVGDCAQIVDEKSKKKGFFQKNKG